MLLHETGRQGPEPFAGMDGPAAQQDLAAVMHHRADHDLGILVVNEAAIDADLALEIVALRDEALEVALLLSGVFAHERFKAATPGRSLPSSHSRKAPPAVET